MKAGSLRSRLILIILTPLLVSSLAAGCWQFRSTTERAEGIFDRGLLSAAVAMRRLRPGEEVVRGEPVGEALAEDLRDQVVVRE